MGRKKQTKEEQQEGQGGREQGGTSKAEAVRVALAEGHEMPEDGTAFILSRFGIEVGRQHFSSIKSNLKKREGTPKGKPGRKRAQGLDHAAAREPAQSRSNGQADVIAALEAIKPLVASMGADKVHRLVDILGQ